MKESVTSFSRVRGEVVGGTSVAGEYWHNGNSAVNCETQGHCYHPGTAVGSLWCCKCGQYKYMEVTLER